MGCNIGHLTDTMLSETHQSHKRDVLYGFAAMRYIETKRRKGGGRKPGQGVKGNRASVQENEKNFGEGKW